MGSVSDLFSGRPSSSGNKAAGHQQNRDTNSNIDSRINSSSSSSTPGGHTGHALHGTITSALWAIARTPALVTAVENVEATFGEEPSLSRLLLQLRDASNLGDAPRVREAADAADVFLKDKGSRLSHYSKMEPMDVIRGIVGLCGDSDQVFEEAVETSYRYFASSPHV